SLKEYTVGLDVFGKPASYDPRQESVVRMHVGRLRQKLAEYYRTEGKDDPVIVDLPKGGFTLTFEPRLVVHEEGRAPAATTPTPLEARWSRRELALAAALLVAVLGSSYLGLRVWRAESAARGESVVPPLTPELQQLWAPLLSSERPLMVSMATPMFAKLPGFGFARDLQANDAPELLKSQSLLSLKAALHITDVAPSYAFTGVGTANGAFLLGQFLGPRKHNVFLIRSDLLSMGEVAMGDVIFLGPPVGKRQIQAIPPVEQPIVLEPEGVRNLKPLPGEAAFFADVVPADPQVLEDSYALIGHLPGLNGNGEFFYLSGNQVASVVGAVQALTDADLARMLVSRLRTPDGSLPRYYQVVLKVRAMDDTPVEVSYVVHRELSVERPELAEKRAE
ncbi:MAG TPA: hypothetical protein VIC04_00925, partial [Terriglobia bacterium]